MADMPQPELVIQARPQISVTLTNAGDEIEIATAGIDDSFNNVEMKEVFIPLESAREVAEAILSILDRQEQ